MFHTASGPSSCTRRAYPSTRVLHDQYGGGGGGRGFCVMRQRVPPPTRPTDSREARSD